MKGLTRPQVELKPFHRKAQMEQIYAQGTDVMSWYPPPYSVCSFDLGNVSFGAAYISIDPYRLMGLPRPNQLLALGQTIEEKIQLAEALVALYARAISQFVTIWADVFNLMPGVEWKNVDMDLTARNLKPRLMAMDAKFAPYTEALYEFQMNRNDKSRTVSSFVRYHYAGVCPVVKIGGGLKNTVTLTPHLDHRLFLQLHDPYKANKMQAKASFQYLASIWGYDISHIPDNVLKDAADAVMQAWAHILTKMKGVVIAKPKPKVVKTRKPRARTNMAEYDCSAS